MRTLVRFRSDKFPAYENEETLYNHNWGKRLAEYLVEELRKRGIETEAMIAEDWGWYVPIKNDGFRLAVGCGHQSGYDDDEFLYMIDPSKPRIRKWFRTIDATAEVTRVADALDAILTADPGIRDVHWLTDTEA